MKAEDQYIIIELEMWITREGNGAVESRHLKTEKDFEWYKVLGKQTRYAIMGASGIKYFPHCLYETPTQHECYFASGCIRTTRSYLRDFDKTYFKFCDDAEEVLKNIKRFISWLKNMPVLSKKGQRKKILAKYGWMTEEVTPTLEWERLSKIEYAIKKRDDLGRLARELQDERDLVAERD